MPAGATHRGLAMPDRIFHGWKVVASCFLIASVSWGLALYGSSVYVQALSAAHGWSVATIAANVTLMYLTAASLQRPVAVAIERWGPRPVLCVAALSLCAGVALIGAISHPGLLPLGFALLGVGWSGLSTTGLSVTVNPWFEKHQGRSITLAVMGASVGAILGVPAMLAGIHQWGLRQGLFVTALVGLAITLPLILWMLRYRSPADMGLMPDGQTLPGAPARDSKADTSLADRPALPADAFPSVWGVASAFALALAVQLGFLTHHLALAAQTLSPAASGSLISATGVAALTGRLVLARWVDRMPVRKVAASMMLIQSGALAAIAWLPNTAVMVVASLAYGFAVGYITTLAPVIVRREQGRERFATRYGAAASLIQFTSACGPGLFGVLHTAFGGYQAVLTLAALATLTAAMVLTARGR